MVAVRDKSIVNLSVKNKSPEPVRSAKVGTRRADDAHRTDTGGVGRIGRGAKSDGCSNAWARIEIEKYIFFFLIVFTVNDYKIPIVTYYDDGQ